MNLGSRVPVINHQHHTDDMNVWVAYRFILAKIDVELCQPLPSDELAWRTVDSLSGKLDSPFMFAFRPEELALHMKQGIRLRRVFDRIGHDLNRFDFFI